MRRRIPPPIVADSLGLTVVYFLTGILSLSLLSETQMHAAEIWIPAGISLAAAWTRGNRMLPAIFAGALLVGLENFAVSSALAFVMPLTAGLQACLSAWLGSILIGKLVGRQNPLLDNRSIAMFFLLGGPVSQFPSALLMTGTGWSLNFISSTEVISQFFSAWLGSSMGVILFSPLTLAFVAQPREDWKPRIYSVALPSILIGFFCFGLIHVAKSTVQQRHQQIFARTVNRVHQQFIDHITEFDELSENLKHFINVLPALPEATFKTLGKTALKERYGIQAIAWIAAQQPTTADQGVSIRYIEPRFFSPLLEMDLSEKHAWREALEQAGKSGESLFLDPLEYTLMCGIKSLAALIRPVGLPAGNRTDKTDSPPRISGYLVYFFDEQSVLNKAIENARRQHLLLTITKVDSETEPAAESHKDNGINLQISALNQRWLLQFLPDDTLAAAYSSPFYGWLVAALYTLIGLSGFLLLSISGQRAYREKWGNERSSRLHQENRFLKSILNHVRQGIIACDSSGSVTVLNEVARNQLGMEPGLLAPEKWVEYYQLYETDAKTPLALHKLPLHQALTGKRVNAFSMVMKKGMASMVLLTHSMPIRDEQDHVIGAVASFEDNTEIFRKNQELKKLTLAIQHCPIGIMVTDAEGKIEYVNHKFEQMNGYTLTEVIGETPMILKSSDIPENISHNKWISLLNGRDWQGEVLNRKKSGEFYWAKLLISPFRNDQGKLLHYVSILEDVTELRKKSEIISYQASHDDLTGLLNRRECEKRLGRIIANTQQQDAHHVFCFLDLDNFKQINDTCGHVAGDEVLRLVSELLIKQLRQRDTLARLGGDEFGIIMEHCYVQQAREIADAICLAIKEYDFYWQDQCFKLGVSIGITRINENSHSFTTVMQEADIACYRAKKQGRGQVEIYSESKGNTDID